MNAGAQPHQHGPPLPGFDRDREREREREMREHELREQEMEARRREREEAAIREEREMRERQHQSQQGEQPPHENHAGSLPLHQPVAMGPQARAMHGPGGLLNNSAPGGAQGAMGGPGGPNSIFGGGPVQQGENAQRLPQGAQNAQQSLPVPPFLGQGGQQQGPMAMGPQGQQPILNDALSYLDQVKVQFQEHPDVYNRFLDIMKDFKSGA